MVKNRNVPFVSISLVAVNIIVFLACFLTGQVLYEIGELGIYGVFYKGQIYRIISCMFLHKDILHIFNNMLILYFVGTMIEKELGHFLFFTSYMISGIAAGMTSLLWKIVTGSMASSIGASGAVFGMDGVLLAIVLFSHKSFETVTLPRLLLMIAYSLYSGFVGYAIDNAAHVGGLVCGFIIGTIICFIKYRDKAV